jgi:hypothetical protein
MATGQTTTTAPTSAQETGRPQPQTTVESAGGPFIRHSQPGRAPLYQVTGTALSGIITQPLVARPGYFRNFRVQHTLVTGGTISTGTLQPDTPYNLNSLIQLKDAFGTPLIVAPGYEVSNLIGMYSGGFGVDNGTNLTTNLPSYTAISATTGAGAFAYALPLEFAKAYGVLSAANASLLPTLQFNLNSAAAIFSGSATGTFPTVTTTVDTDFYWLPEGTATEPPGLGTTRQWLLQQANPQLSASSTARVQFPRLGGYLDTIILEVRNNAGARTDGFWPGGSGTTISAGNTNRLQLYVDGVPMIDSTMSELFDDQWIMFGAVTRPTGVLAISRKTSLAQKSFGLLETGESFLSTNPATLLEANFAPAGSGNSDGPAQVSVIVGQIVPTGAIIQGLPEA